MKRNTDYTSDAVRDSIQETMSRVKEYFDENWAEGKEYVVLKHIQDILGQEIDKYLPQGAARDIYFHFASIDGSKKRYEEYYAKSLRSMDRTSWSFLQNTDILWLFQEDTTLATEKARLETRFKRI